MRAERLRPMMQLRDTMEIERLKRMGIDPPSRMELDWELTKTERSDILTILSLLTIPTVLSASIVLISMGGYAASFGLAYLLALVFLWMMELVIYKSSRHGGELIPTIVADMVTMVGISMGEYAVYFICLLVLVLLGIIGFICTSEDRGKYDGELPLLTLFTIVNVTIALILMGGYAAYFGYLLALISLCIGGCVVIFAYTYSHSL